MKSAYLWVDFLTIIIPLVFSFHPKLNFYKNFKPFFFANGITAIIFIAWDVLFTTIGVWGFNPNYVTGVYFLKLPIEEILFFVCIPFSCVFTYHCFNIFFSVNWKSKTEAIFISSIAFLLIITGFINLSKLYTATTFISLGILILFLKYFSKVNWLAKLIFIYPVILIPFFIVNGVLTGNGLEQPIVWYDDTENLGIRLITIPLEDIFYGFELILLNIYFYENFKNKFSNTN